MINEKCQVPTPVLIAEEMLNEAGYIHNLYGKKVLENSCGEGNILCQIVERYIVDCQQEGFSNKEIRTGLENDIHGYELDEKLHTACLNNLNILL